jgi:predicted DCC family thiol-disulfide oxidoreductase YuxK
MASADAAGAMGAYTPLVLYDGVCGLCNGFVRFAVRRDRRAVLKFAPLDSAIGRAIIARHAALAGRDSIVFVDRVDAQETVAAQSDAVVQISRHLGALWSGVGRAYGLLPRALRDLVYDAIARRRYAWFGKLDACPIPTAEERARFVGFE